MKRINANEELQDLACEVTGLEDVDEATERVVRAIDFCRRQANGRNCEIARHFPDLQR